MFIFCYQVRTKQFYERTENLEKTKFEYDGSETVQKVLKNGDEKLLNQTRLFTQFSVEVHYHPSCRKAYTRPTLVGRSSYIAAKRKQEKIEKAHVDAFAVVCFSVLKQIVEMKQIMRLEELRELYVKELDKMQGSNPNYWADELKSKLENHDTIIKEIGILNLLGKTSKGFRENSIHRLPLVK